MNWKLILRILGILLFIEAGLMAVCMVVAALYRESLFPFLWPTLGSVAIGSALCFSSRHTPVNMGRKDGYMIVSTAWVMFSLVGMWPFLLSGTLPDAASAFFETMSGFTSTGSTAIDNCDIQPRAILFWRSLTQWIGGIGIIFFTIAILPAFGIGEVKLFAAESTGPFRNKVHPRISVAARWIGTVYVLLTLLCALALLLCGMSLFDAVNHAFTTTATGGFSTHSSPLHEAYGSPAVEYVITLFMLVSGTNYTLIYYSFLKGHFRHFFQDAELRCYLGIAALCTLVCLLTLFIERVDWGSLDWSGAWPLACSLELAFRESIFTIISIQTTTGFASCDFTAWPVMLMPVLLFIMFAGACSGSTSSGFKCVRWSIIWRVVKGEVKRILHPRAFLPVRMNGQVISTQVIQTQFAYAALFTGAIFGGAFLLACTGVAAEASRTTFDYYEALGIALSSVSNVGPGMGYYGPMHSWAILSPFAKLICSLLMLIGRLEIFPVLLLFTPGFWKKS